MTAAVSSLLVASARGAAPAGKSAGPTGDRFETALQAQSQAAEARQDRTGGADPRGAAPTVTSSGRAALERRSGAATERASEQSPAHRTRAVDRAPAQQDDDGSSGGRRHTDAESDAATASPGTAAHPDSATQLPPIAVASAAGVVPDDAPSTGAAGPTPPVLPTPATPSGPAGAPVAPAVLAAEPSGPDPQNGPAAAPGPTVPAPRPSATASTGSGAALPPAAAPTPASASPHADGEGSRPHPAVASVLKASAAPVLPPAAGLLASSATGSPSTASPVAAAAATPISPETTAPTLAEQLGVPIRTLAAAGNGQHVVTVRVTPDHLGTVTVRAEVGDGSLRVELFSTDQHARDALAAMLPDLRRDLASNGPVGTTSLSLGADGRGAGGGRNAPGDSGRRDAQGASVPSWSASRDPSPTPAPLATSAPGRLDVLA